MRWAGTRLLSLLVRLLGATWRVRVEGADHLHALRRANSPFIYALWHRTLVPLLWWHRNEGITLLVSEHGDAAYLAEVAARWGYRTVRGSSTRGGVKALRGVLRALGRHGRVAITPDGPRGPAGAVKGGVVMAARHAGVPVLPVSADAAPALRARSWDGMLIPLPFARVRIAYAPALLISADMSGPAAGAELAGRLDTVAAKSTWVT